MLCRRMRLAVSRGARARSRLLAGATSEFSATRRHPGHFDRAFHNFSDVRLGIAAGSRLGIAADSRHGVADSKLAIADDKLDA